MRSKIVGFGESLPVAAGRSLGNGYGKYESQDLDWLDTNGKAGSYLFTEIREKTEKAGTKTEVNVEIRGNCPRTVKKQAEFERGLGRELAKLAGRG